MCPAAQFIHERMHARRACISNTQIIAVVQRKRTPRKRIQVTRQYRAWIMGFLFPGTLYMLMRQLQRLPPHKHTCTVRAIVGGLGCGWICAGCGRVGPLLLSCCAKVFFRSLSPAEFVRERSMLYTWPYNKKGCRQISSMKKVSAPEAATHRECHHHRFRCPGMIHAACCGCCRVRTSHRTASYSQRIEIVFTTTRKCTMMNCFIRFF